MTAASKSKYAAECRLVDIFIDPPDKPEELGAFPLKKRAIIRVGNHLDGSHFKVLTVVVTLNVHFVDGVF